MSFPLDRHLVIEASAGTGKTYAIESIVLDIIKERGVPLERILLVTFTEKATGDLRHRLRERLRKETNPTPLILQALDRFDRASIFTIHGFCQRILREYALEQGSDFQPCLVEDVALQPVLLQEVERRRWRTEMGPHLEAVLGRLRADCDAPLIEGGQPRRDWAKNLDAINKGILNVARGYRSAAGHRLLPAPLADWWTRLAEGEPTRQLLAQTVLWLEEELIRHKRERGLLSFDDMIARVAQNLDPAKNPVRAESLANLLRERFPYAIVDEFQDTDPLQWRIFRRVFLESDACRLFVVGDPKQAIFQFRGGDLPTYLAATQTMREDFGASSEPLGTNWRSDPNLLKGLNRLLLDGDFFPQACGIRYTPVGWPEASRNRMGRDDTGRSPMTLVDLRDQTKLSDARWAFARFTAREIKRLLSDPPRMTHAKKGEEPRPLQADDIAIIIHSRDGDGGPICAALEEHGVPYSFYKKSGLWVSDEAVLLRTVLRSLRDPEDRGAFRRLLLTPLFGFTPDQLAKAGEFGADHLARRLYQKWLELAQKRAWSSLFQSVLEETGLIARGLEQTDAERRLANFRFLAGQLEQAGHGRNLDLVELLQWLGGKGRDAESESDVQPIETTQPKVQILTAHAAKGLEYPIVFSAGGFTKSNKFGDTGPGGFLEYRGGDGERVFHFGAGDTERARRSSEMEEERRRLLYVALTRPIFKLYVPWVAEPQRKTASFYGPLLTLLAPALERAKVELLGGEVCSVVAGDSLGRSELTWEGRAKPKEAGWKLQGELFPELDEGIPFRRVVLRSYSSLHRKKVATLGEETRYSETPRPNPDEAPDVAEAAEPLKGPVFGDMVHRVFERIDFAEVDRAGHSDDLLREASPARRLIETQIRASIDQIASRLPRPRLESEGRRQIAQLVFTALHTPLAGVGPLCEIPKGDRLHELEFLFPEADTPGTGIEGYLTGIMDLVFRKDGRTYLLDWKSNLLPSYDAESLAAAMAGSDYHRQYRLYAQALRRWFRARHALDGEFERSFGGVFYLFVRGMNGTADGAGVYFHRPTPEDLRLENVLDGP